MACGLFSPGVFRDNTEQVNEYMHLLEPLLHHSYDGKENTQNDNIEARVSQFFISDSMQNPRQIKCGIIAKV